MGTTAPANTARPAHHAKPALSRYQTQGRSGDSTIGTTGGMSVHWPIATRVWDYGVAIGPERPPGLSGVAVVYLIQHGEKERLPGDPGLTPLGRRQAVATGAWLRGESVCALYASPLRRARETAGYLAAATGLSVHCDARLRERLNWDGRQPLEAFLAVWGETARDRDLLPAGGESSRQAAARLQGFLVGLRGRSGPVAAVTHGGVTTELLRTLAGDDALPSWVLDSGIPPCAVTTVRDLTVVVIADTAHLR